MTPTTREVENCEDCPAMNNDFCSLLGRELTGEEFDDVYRPEVPTTPAACPLRVAPVLVVLKVKP